MSLTLICGLGAVLIAFAIVGYEIWQWGPGLRNHSVICPIRKRTARVLAEQRESEFGNLRVLDVEHCSLLNGAEVSCGKDCIPLL
jgi:hypothetical protein